MMTGNEIRRQFLDYFEKHHHQVVRSSSLVPQDDPTLLFVNAGMVQFKRTFLGEEVRSYKRAVTSQKCVRAGGKHNDLENVGYTARHHTFFEMLGNFSFGDYFKEQAIEFAWDLLTRGYGLDPEKLWVSVYLDDDEAHDLWHRNIGVPADRIVRFGEKDNFWSMGDTGPCGPCSEILIDRGPEFGCDRPDCRVGCECDRYLEIWNLVFMQYNRDADGTMTPLPKPSIDTGMGLERIASLIQQTPTNYETDLIRPVIAKTEELAELGYGASPQGDVAMKVIADHSRAAAFLIGDGVLPSNEGRGYVLRRILRRAIRYGRQIGLTRPFLHQTTRVVFEIMADAYPELLQSSAFIENVVQNEEQRFSETLENGLKLLNDTLAAMRARGEREVPGDVIFKLYDTFGFPLDIVRDVVRDEDMALDTDGFDAAMERQRERSKSVTAFTGIGDAFKALTAQGIQIAFAGYTSLAADSEVLLLVVDGEAVEEAGEGQSVEVVTAATPFYGEAGGQVGDTGRIAGEGLAAEVEQTVKDPTGLVVHRARVVSGRMRKGDTVTLTVDATRRSAIARNHTATHILHAALGEVLGEHVKQSGSMVAPDRLRFDFTHFSQMTPEELQRVEALVNRRIRENRSVQTEEMDVEEAFQAGATALFEEKYGERVRVISLADFSKELCGGCHTNSTGDIGLFRIVAESSVAAGVRRIEALTGDAALQWTQAQTRILQEVARQVKEKPEDLPSRIEALVTRQKALEKQIEQLQTQMAALQAESESDETRQIAGVPVVVKKVAVDSPAALRDLADRFKDKLQSGVVVLGCGVGAKALLIVGVTRDLTDRFHAGKIVKEVAALVGGGGGGRPDMAQAGGTQPENLEEALARVPEILEKMSQ